MKAMLKSVLVLVLTGVTILLCYLFPNAATDSQTGMELVLPKVIPGHLAYDREVSELEKEWLPADTGMLKRVYYPKDAVSQADALGRSVSATLILSGSDQRSLHRPEVCLVSQGWTIKNQTVVPLEINGKRLKLKDLHLEMMQMQPDDTLKKIQAHYVYGWIGSKVSTHDSLQRALISAKENMFYNRNTRWGYPSVMTYVRLDEGEERAAAQKRAYDFYEEYGEVFLKNYRE